MKSGAHLRRVCDEAIVKPRRPTLVLFNDGLINQFNKKIREKVLPEAGGLRVLWIETPVPRGYKTLPECRVPEEGKLNEAALLALGESTDRFRDILATLDAATGPRHCNASLTAGVFFVYEKDTDTEYHVPIHDVAHEYDKGTLRAWICDYTGLDDPPGKRR